VADVVDTNLFLKTLGSGFSFREGHDTGVVHKNVNLFVLEIVCEFLD
jgi:hypothetical protein